MSLSADQQAMLQLVLERGQSYGDLAALLGVDEPEIRSRARAALTELAGTDPDRSVGLTDWLLGQADPIGRADAVRHLRDDPDDHRLAAGLLEKLGSLAPDADLPKLPAEPRGGFRRRAAARSTTGAATVEGTASSAPVPARENASAAASTPVGTSLSSAQSRLWVALGCAAVILLLAVLAITGAFSGDSDEGPTAATTDTQAGTGGDGSDTTGQNGTAGPGREITTVDLRPRAGGDARGEATFGTEGGAGYLDVSVTGLEPPPQGEAYILWLLLNGRSGHPLAPVPVSADGTFQDRIQIPSFAIPVAARTHFVDVSLAPSRELGRRILKAATAEQASPVLDYLGRSVLRGEVETQRAAAAAGGGSNGDGGSGSGPSDAGTRGSGSSSGAAK